MHLYSAFGLQIDSDIPIFLLNKNKTLNEEFLANVSIINNEALKLPLQNYSQDIFTHATGMNTLFYRKEIGIFNITKEKIEYKKSRHCSDHDFLRVLLSLPIGYCLMYNNNLVVHASVVSKNGNASLFIGKSGMGKSVLAYQLIDKDFKFLSEDVCTITEENFVQPSMPFIKLSDEFINNKFQETYQLNSDKRKRKGLFIDQNKFLDSPQKIKNIFILNSTTSDICEITNITKKKSLPLIFKNSFKSLPLLSDKKFDEQVINRILNIDNEVNFYNVFNAPNRHQERNEKIEILIS
tara:strand:- start:9614 stop:10498 length:885 start_codon:yes stop_codon:yes gene_type:complete